MDKKRSTVYHDNITDTYDQVLPENQKLVKEFLRYCKSNDKSPQTIKQYEQWLKVFFCWNLAENDNKLFTDVKKRDFTNYIGYLRELDMSSHRIAALKSVLSALSNEIELLYEDEYPTFRNQIRSLEAVHIEPVREKTVLSTEQVDEILNKLVEQKQYQVACYLALICSSGARKAEILQMKPSFFTENAEIFDGYMYATPLIRSKGKGKKGKMIKKYIIKSMFRPYFDLWMKEREELGITNEYLFVTRRNGEWQNATISVANKFAKRISEVLNIEFYSHSGRHYFCTMLKRMHFPDDVIMQIFSWSSDMIKIYDDTPAEEKLNSFFEAFMNKEVKGE